ncbi:MAG: ABC transporter substrate-binding protein [Bacilli bacterium]|nr:ABC transporter substrate-binding protein [Bacilli bacterium]
MQRNKFILGLSLVAIFATTSCGSRGFKHTPSHKNYAYSADLNHDGTIGSDEKNHAWADTYDKILDDANEMHKLNQFANDLQVKDDEPKRTSLARYELLHQAEEMLMHTNAVTPLYNYADPYLLSPELSNLYASPLGYKFLDEIKDAKGIPGGTYTMSFGTKADTFDPAVNTDASTANVILHIYRGAKYWRNDGRDGPAPDPHDPARNNQANTASLADGICTVKKYLVIDSDSGYDDESGTVGIETCPDLMEEIELYPQAEQQAIIDKYVGTARYVITTQSQYRWNDGKPVSVDDFIYAWSRTSSAIYNNSPMGMWCSLFDMVRGYSVWNTVGQQEGIDKTLSQPEEQFAQFNPDENFAATKPQKYDEEQTFNNVIRAPEGVETDAPYAVVNIDLKAGDAKDWEAALNLKDAESGRSYLTPLTKEDILQWSQNYRGVATLTQPSGAMGGMAGVMKTGNNEMTVQLINDSEYFEELLAFPAWMPVRKDEIRVPREDESGKKVDETDAISTEKPAWYMNKGGKDGLHYTNGPLAIDGPIDNNDGGKITLVKNGKSNTADSENVEKLTLKFIDKDGSAYDQFNSGAIQMTDVVPSSLIDKERADPTSKQNRWHIAPQIGLFFFIFNVNDNTFDFYNNVTDDPTQQGEGERIREQFREILNLLINRNDLVQNIVKTGCEAANGTVSTEITEKAIPISVTIDGTPCIIAQRGKWDDSEGKLVPLDPPTTQAQYEEYINGEDHELMTKDWHERNRDMFNHWEDGDYKDHWFTTRDDETQRDDPEKSGFYSCVTTTDQQKEKDSMNSNIKRAIKIAEELEKNENVKKSGFCYNKQTGQFENFPSITLSTNTGTGIEDICERMQAYYSLWGIDMSIQTQEWQSYTATRRSGDYAYARHGWVADYNDPRTYLDIFKSSDGNNDTQLGRNSEHLSK